jgi:hypothetical protein
MVRWPQFKRWTANSVIVILLVLLVGDAMPWAPESVRAWTEPAVNRLGIGHGRWSMFSPPDRANHRLRAEITLRDGRVVPHAFPDLQAQSVWQRFIGHRRSEYVDNAIVVGRQYPDVWNHLSDYLARQYAGNGGGVAQVRIIVELAIIPSPGSSPWLPRQTNLPYDDQRVVYREKYR